MCVFMFVLIFSRESDSRIANVPIDHYAHQL